MFDVFNAVQKNKIVLLASTHENNVDTVVTIIISGWLFLLIAIISGITKKKKLVLYCYE